MKVLLDGAEGALRSNMAGIRGVRAERYGPLKNRWSGARAALTGQSAKGRGGGGVGFDHARLGGNVGRWCDRRGRAGRSPAAAPRPAYGRIATCIPRGYLHGPVLAKGQPRKRTVAGKQRAQMLADEGKYAVGTTLGGYPSRRFSCCTRLARGLGTHGRGSDSELLCASKHFEHLVLLEPAMKSSHLSNRCGPHKKN